MRSASVPCKSTNWEDQFRANAVSRSSPVTTHEGVKLDGVYEFLGIQTSKDSDDLAGPPLPTFDDATTSPIDADKSRHKSLKRTRDDDLRNKPTKRRAVLLQPHPLVVKEEMSFKRHSPGKLEERPAKRPICIYTGPVVATDVNIFRWLKRKTDDDVDNMPGKPPTTSSFPPVMEDTPAINDSTVIHKTTLLCLPNELIKSLAAYLTGGTRRSDIRCLTCVNRLFANIFAQPYMEEVGLKLQRKCLTLRTSGTSDAYTALLVWRRSHLWTELQTLTCSLSPILDQATNEGHLLLNFLQSLPIHSTIHAKRFVLRVHGAERMMLSRVLAHVHRLNCSEIFIFTATEQNSIHSVFSRPVRAGDMPHLTRFEVHGDVVTSAYLYSWCEGVCANTKLRTIRLEGVGLCSSTLKQLLTATFPCLEEISIDQAINLLDLVEFLRRHPCVLRINVLSNDLSNHRMLLSGHMEKLWLPKLQKLGGPAQFLVAIFNHLQPPPKSLFMVTIRPDGRLLDGLTVEKVLDTHRARAEQRLVHVTHVTFHRLVHREDYEENDQNNIIDWLTLFPCISVVNAAVGARDPKLFVRRLLNMYPRLKRISTTAV
ncbi:hypothetical protein BD410DRAFT_843523 [Rickenella mellea]|uniref:Uncharacterized protein n=1 Tax=Rickenella mellea TaxID=50990 RepID=A0A4Y7PRE4_9AGAM|nr:hypothetical protein BD410DRAFT_843523 [Rickenella mellea]